MVTDHIRRRPRTPQRVQHEPHTYYTGSEPIRLREYGRCVQRMVDFLTGVPDPERQRLLANEVVRVMATVAPDSRDREDYRKKLWEHIFRIAPAESLDTLVPPFEIDRHTNIEMRAPVPYYPIRTVYRQYGRNVELMVAKALEMAGGDERDDYVQQIATIMKQLLLNHDANLPPDQVVIDHLFDMSEGQIELELEGTRLKVLAGPMPALPQRGRRNNNKKKKKPRAPLGLPQQPPNAGPTNGGGNNKRRGRGSRRRPR